MGLGLSRSLADRRRFVAKRSLASRRLMVARGEGRLPAGGGSICCRVLADRRQTPRLRTSDNSGRASVGITVFLGKRPVGYLHTPLKKRIAGHAYTATWRSYRFNGPLRFCVEAYDPSGNESSRSCAPIAAS